MGLSATGWIFTIFILFMATFGFWSCLKIVIIITLFVLGIMTAFYTFVEDTIPRRKMYDLLANPLEHSDHPRNLSRLMLPKNETNDFIQSFEITGHEEVDGFLNEMLDAATEDYVTSWYSSISTNNDFLKAIKLTASSFAVELANRMKSVDWLVHITGRVIEDMACHLRLFRGAGGNASSSNIRSSRRGSPSHSPARTSPHHRRNKSDTDIASFSGVQQYTINGKSNFNGSTTSLEQKFFEIESEIQKQKFGKGKISMDEKRKSLLISELSQMLLFLTIKNEIKCNSASCLLRTIISIILEMTIDYITNPDTLNTFVLRLSSRDSLSTESFLSILRATDNIEELKATLSLVQKEIHKLVSRDSGGECDIGVKQQLSSLQYLTRVLSNRTSVLAPTVTSIMTPTVYTKLPLGFLLDNHLALCYFLDFAHSVSSHQYIFCYLSIEAWHAAALKQLAEIEKTLDKDKSPMETIKAAAFTTFEQYFTKETHSIDIPSHMLDSFRAKKNLPCDSSCLSWFSDIEKHIYTKLEGVENAFRSSNQYIRLLAELDLEDVPPENMRVSDHRRTGSMGNPIYGLISNANDKVIPNVPTAQDSPCRLEVVIIETGLMQERGKSYGVYSLEVKKWDSLGRQSCWHVYRRYSDFLELNNIIKDAYPELGKLEFPSKKTFHNTSRNVLERRMVALSSWISKVASLSSPGCSPRYAPLHLYLLPFLNPRGPQDKQQPTAINAMLVQPLRQGMRTLRNVPEQLANTVDDIMGGISKLITNKGNSESQGILDASIVTKGFDVEGNYESEELPLRVVLLLLDEVFELRCRNRWLRRQIVTILRQILTTMFSDTLNKKIIESISSVTSPESIAYCLQSIKRTFFAGPNKFGDKELNTRDAATQARARVATKTILLSFRQDELRHLIGSQTTQRGLLTVFELFQNRTLNIRLVFILIEGLFKVMYQDRELQVAFLSLFQGTLKDEDTFNTIETNKL